MLMKEYSDNSEADSMESDEQKKTDDLSRIYETVDAVESGLENYIAEHAYLIEEGLVCLDHSFSGDGRLNALLLDSDNSLVVAEIKIGDSSDMLTHCLDYYNKIMQNLSDYARLLNGDGEMKIETSRRPRMMLISSEFSHDIIERLKWMSIDVSAFQIKCIKPRDSKKILPVFFKVSFPETPDIQENPVREPQVFEKKKSFANLDIYFDSRGMKIEENTGLIDENEEDSPEKYGEETD